VLHDPRFFTSFFATNVSPPEVLLDFLPCSCTRWPALRETSPAASEYDVFFFSSTNRNPSSAGCTQPVTELWCSARNSSPAPAAPIFSQLSRSPSSCPVAGRTDTVSVERSEHVNVWLLDDSGNEHNEPHFGLWQDWGDTLMRFVYQPSVWLKPGDAIPSCPSCGTPFKKENEYASMISYTANCLDLHDPEQAS